MCDGCITHCHECGEAILNDQEMCFGPDCKHVILEILDDSVKLGMGKMLVMPS